MVPIPGSSWTNRRNVATPARVRPNYALERSVTASSECASRGPLNADVRQPVATSWGRA